MAGRSEPASLPGETGEATRRRPGPPCQDRATYNCHCGYVFEEAVSTAVSCPHCGYGQVW